MRASSKANGRILKKYEVVLLLIALVLILIVSAQRPSTPKLQGVGQKSFKIGQ